VKGKTKILGVALSLVLMLSLMVFALPVSAGTLSWSTVTIPSTTGNVLAPDTHILDLAVAGDEETIYAAAGVFVSVATLEAGGSTSTATWSATEVEHGSTSAKLVNADGRSYVEFIPAAGTTMSDLASGEWGYRCKATGGVYSQPCMELRFTSPTFDADTGAEGNEFWGHADVNITNYDFTGEWEYEDATLNDRVYAYFNDPTDGTAGSIVDPNWTTLALILAAIDASGVMTTADPDDSAAEWELTRVQIDVWDAGGTCYIDSVTIDGTTYNLEGTDGSSADGEALIGGCLYKSTNAGETWSGLTNPTNAEAPQLVAVAPDDEDIVAIVADVNEVYITTDGGTTWGDLKFALTATDTVVINDIAISAESGGTHYIALAAEDAAGAEVWRYNIGAAAPSWKEISDADDYPGFEAAGVTAAAVAFSPNFPSDQVMVVVTSSSTDVQLQIFSENQDQWNDTAGFDGYPVPIVEDEDTAITGLTSASIALDLDYLGSDDAMRLAFVGLTLAAESDETNNGIYRLDNTTVKALKDGSAIKIYSIAYDGSTLVAGRYDSNVCYYCTDPTATTPTVPGTRSLKRPGASDNTKTVVAWAGGDVVAGTSGDESAFAVSTNNGKSFSDISLIDTALTNMTDVAVSPDGSKVFMATDDGDFSLWRYASSWERVLAVPEKAGFIVRLAPDDPDVVYVAEKYGTAIYYSADGGTERWQARTFRYTDGVKDLAVEGEGDVVYVAVKDTNKVSKSTNAGFTWGSYKSSSLDGDVNMIVSLGEDLLLVGGTTGYVSYSTNGNSSWTKIGKQLGDGGVVSVIASGLADEDYIYAGLKTTEDEIYRWQIGVDTSWTSIYEAATTVDIPVYGIALQDGVLYVSTVVDDTNSMTLRTLNPTAAVAPTWSEMVKEVQFTIEPQGLKVGGGKLWAIDNTDTDKLYSYTDIVMDVVPTLVGPADGFVNKINPISGYAMDVAFSWEKPSAKVTAYQLSIAFDKDFDEVLDTIDVASTSSKVSKVVGHAAEIVLMPGATYFWKVRVSAPTYSPWSKVRCLVVEEAEVPVMPAPVVTVEPTPAPPAPVVTVQPPEVTVTVPPYPEPAPVIPAYLLWTIITIGAVLVIALIVLIVRTRRVV